MSHPPFIDYRRRLKRLARVLRRDPTPAERKLWLWISVAVNLSMLGFFKYGNFLLENFTWVLARGGIQYKPPHLDVFLPIGISFYTFHSLSYTLDIYRGVMKPTRRLRDFDGVTRVKFPQDAGRAQHRRNRVLAPLRFVAALPET